MLLAVQPLQVNPAAALLSSCPAPRHKLKKDVIHGGAPEARKQGYKTDFHTDSSSAASSKGQSQWPTSWQPLRICPSRIVTLQTVALRNSTVRKNTSKLLKTAQPEPMQDFNC